jgi:hypothetical protein
MELLKRATKAESNLQCMIQRSTDFKEISQLEDLRQLLLGLSNTSAEIAKKIVSLKENNVPLTVLPEIAIINQLTKNLSDKFNETPKSTSVFEGKKWANFYEKITSEIKNTAKSVENDWAKFFTRLFGGMRPEEIRGRLIKTPENNVAIESYTKLYNELMRYKASIPEDKVDYITIRNLVKKLSEIKFQEDIPEDVKKFFTQTSFGASLEYLTGDVMAWLRKNDLLSSFEVRAKR